MAVNKLLESKRTPHYRQPCGFPSYAIDSVNLACLPHSKVESLYDRSSASKVLTAERAMDALGNLTVANTTWRGPFGYAGGKANELDSRGLGAKALPKVLPVTEPIMAIEDTNKHGSGNYERFVEMRIDSAPTWLRNRPDDDGMDGSPRGCPVLGRGDFPAKRAVEDVMWYVERL